VKLTRNGSQTPSVRLKMSLDLYKTVYRVLRPRG